MKKLTILTIFVCIGLLVVLLLTFGHLLGTQAVAKLSDETLKEVEKLRWKHYPFFYAAEVDEWTWEQSYPYISWEDGILYITTEDEKWFVKMEKIEKED